MLLSQQHLRQVMSPRCRYPDAACTAEAGVDSSFDRSVNTGSRPQGCSQPIAARACRVWPCWRLGGAVGWAAGLDRIARPG